MNATDHDRDEQDARILGVYRQCQDRFDRLLAAVPGQQWDMGSACKAWTARDVVGHVIWGQELVRHLATGREYDSQAGMPGAEHPGQLAANNPLSRWRAARAAADAVLTDEARKQPAPPRFVAQHPGAKLSDFLEILALDFLAHTWDIGYPLDLDVHLDPSLLTQTMPTARKIVVRGPGMFDPELTPPPGADEQTRWLSFLGRPSSLEAPSLSG